MLRIFIGYDKNEIIAYHVLCHSIIRRSSIPVQITPIRLEALRAFYNRPKACNESTEFSVSRFLTPYLANYNGLALFMDCDMLMLADVAELIELQKQQPSKAILVCKHEYTPRQEKKFLGNKQVAYPRKNWSSFMLFNLNHYDCKRLTPEVVAESSPADLHRFRWVSSGKLGELPLEWNWLVGEYEENHYAKVLHYTNGGPWFQEYKKSPLAYLWFEEFMDLASPINAGVLGYQK